MKIIIDTNMLIAAFFNKKSASARIIRESREGNIKLLWTDRIKKEAEFILGNIQKSVGRKAKDVKIDDIFLERNKVENPPEVQGISEDPDDDKFLSCAKGGGADLIISNDRHLLDLKKFEGIPIEKPSRALDKIKNKVK